MESGSEMVAVVRSLKDSGLAVTLFDNGRQYTLCPRAAVENHNLQTNPGLAQSCIVQPCMVGPERSCPMVSTGVLTEHVTSGLRQDSAAQAVDGRYSSVYQTTYCRMAPTSPSYQATEFPSQATQLCPGQTNFVVGGAGSGDNMYKHARTNQYRSGMVWSDRGTVFARRSSQDPDPFASSLRSYPSSPERSTETVERLSNYTQATGISISKTRLRTYGTRECGTESHSSNQHLSRSPSPVRRRREESPTRDKPRKEGNEEHKRGIFYNEYDVRYLRNTKSQRNHWNHITDVNPTTMVNTKVQAAVSTSDRYVETSTRDRSNYQNAGVPVSPAVSSISASQEAASQTVPQSSPNITHIELSGKPSQLHTKSCETFTVSSIQLSVKDSANPGDSIPLPSVSATLSPIKTNKSSQAILPNIISVDTSISSTTLPSMKHPTETRRIRSESFFENQAFNNDLIKDIFQNAINQSTKTVCDDVFDIFEDQLEKIPDDTYNYYYSGADNENSINSFINYDNFTFNNCYTTVYRAEITNDNLTSNYEIVIADWVSDLPLKQYDFLGRKVEKDKIFMTFINKLKRAANQTEFDRIRSKADIVKILDEIPLDLNGYSSKRVFMHKLANVLIDNIQKLNIFYNGESSNSSKKNFYPTVAEMREFVTTEMSDFIDKYHSEINLNRIIEIEDELVDILINFTESIRVHDTDLVGEEIVVLLRDSGGLFEHQAIYLTSVMLEHLTEIFRLVEESIKPLPSSESHKCQTYMMMNNINKTSPNTTTDSEEKIRNNFHKAESNVDLCIQQLSRQIEEWLASLPVQIMQNRDDSFIQVVIHDLATDIIDRQKYVALNPKGRNVDADFENLKFQLFKWINRLSEDSKVALEHAGDLMKRIKNVTDVLFKQKLKDKSCNLFGKTDLKVLPMLGPDSACCQPKPPPCCEPRPPECCKEQMGRFSLPQGGGPSPYTSAQTPGRYSSPGAMQGQYGPAPGGMQAQFGPGSSGMQTQFGPGPSGMQAPYGTTPSGMQAQYGPGPSDMQAQYDPGPSGMQAQYGPGPSGMQQQQGMNNMSESVQFGGHDQRVFDPEPLPLPPGMTIQDVNNEYDEFLKVWVQQIPLEANTPEEKQMAEMMRKGIYNGVWKTIAKLKGDVELMKNRFYYEDVFDGEIEELFNMLPQTQDLVAEKPRLKVELTDRTSQLNEMIRHYVAPDAFKENLIDKANSYVPRLSYDLKGENAIKLAEDLEIMKLVDEFILSTKYQDEDPVKANVHRRRLLTQVQTLVKHLKENHGKELADITPEVYVNDLLLALQQVPKPDQSIVTEEADSVLMQMEVNEWAKDLPLQPHENPKEHMKRRRQMDKLAHKLHEMEKSLNLSDSNADREVRHEISDFLDRLPMERGATLNINFMVDELMNRVKTRVKQRDQKAGKHVHSLGGGYEGFSSDKPFASSFNDSGMQPRDITGEGENWQTMADSGEGPMDGSMMQPGQGMGGQPMAGGQPMPMMQSERGRSQSMGGQPMMGQPMMPPGQAMSQSMGGQPMGGPLMMPSGQMGGPSVCRSPVCQAMGGQPMGGQPMMPSGPGMSHSLGGQPMGGQGMMPLGSGMFQSMGGQSMGGQSMGGQSMGGQPMGGHLMGGQSFSGQPSMPSSGRLSQSLYIGGQPGSATGDSVAWQTMADSRGGSQMGAPGMPNQFMSGQQMGGQPMGGQQMGGQPMGGQAMRGQSMGGMPMGGQPMTALGQGRSQSMGAQPIGGQPMMLSGQPRSQSLGGQLMGSQQMGGQPMSGQSRTPSSGQGMSQSIRGQPGSATGDSIAWQTMSDSRAGAQMGGSVMQPGQPMGNQPMRPGQGRSQSLGGQPMAGQLMGGQQLGGQPMGQLGQARSQSMGGQPTGGPFMMPSGPRAPTTQAQRPPSNTSLENSQLVQQPGSYRSFSFERPPASSFNEVPGSNDRTYTSMPGSGGSPGAQGGFQGRQSMQGQAGPGVRQTSSRGSLVQGGSPAQGYVQGGGQSPRPSMQSGGLSRQPSGTQPGRRISMQGTQQSPMSPAQGGRLSLIRETPMQDAGQQSGQPSIRSPSSVGLQTGGVPGAQTRTPQVTSPRRQSSGGQSSQTGQVSPEPRREGAGGERRVSIEQRDSSRARDAIGDDTFHTARDQSGSIQDQSMPCHGKKQCVNGCCCPCCGGQGSVVQKCAQGKTKEQCTCTSFDNSGRSSPGPQFFKSTDKEGISHFTNQNRQPSRCTESCKERIARANQSPQSGRKVCYRKSSEEEINEGKKCRCLERLKKYRKQRQLCMDIECCDHRYNQSY